MMDHHVSSRSTLATNHLRSLGLDRNPFMGNGPLILDPARREALTELRAWIHSIVTDPVRRDRLAVLTAEPGMGKSSFLRQIAAGTVEGINAPLIDPGKGGITDAQLLRAIIDAFGGTATGRTGMDLRRDIRHALADLPQDVVPGLLIDDADYSGPRLELLRNVLRDGADRGLFIVLTGLPDLADRLGRRRSFRAILGPTVQLGAIDAPSLRDIIASRIGTRPQPIISDDAIAAMVDLSGGNPGWLLRLAGSAVEAAARQGQDRVGRASVISVSGSLEDTSGRMPDAVSGSTQERGAIQAEIPLFAAGEAIRSQSPTTQRTLWEGGSGDDRVPD